MTRVVHFEIHASDPAKLVAFYSAVFDWKLNAVPGMEYWMIDTGAGEGIHGGLMRRHGEKPADGQPVNAYVCSVAVPSVDDYVKRATGAGATIALPKMAIPHVGYQAYVKDPDGNILGLHQADPSAK